MFGNLEKSKDRSKVSSRFVSEDGVSVGISRCGQPKGVELTIEADRVRQLHEGLV